MGSDISHDKNQPPEDEEDGGEWDCEWLPELVLVIEAVAWRQGLLSLGDVAFNSDGVFCAVSIDGIEFGRTVNFPSHPMWIQASKATSRITFRFFDEAEPERFLRDDVSSSCGRSEIWEDGSTSMTANSRDGLLSELTLPLGSFVRYGLPLFTSLWLGLVPVEEGTASGLITDSLMRAATPESPKVHVTLFKPTSQAFDDEDHRNSYNSFAPSPDIEGFLVREDKLETMACCSSHHGRRLPNAPKQLRGVFESLRTANKQGQALQSAIIQSRSRRDSPFGTELGNSFSGKPLSHEHEDWLDSIDDSRDEVGFGGFSMDFRDDDEVQDVEKLRVQLRALQAEKDMWLDREKEMDTCMEELETLRNERETYSSPPVSADDRLQRLQEELKGALYESSNLRQEVERLKLQLRSVQRPPTRAFTTDSFDGYGQQQEDTSGLEMIETMFRQELLDAAQQLREEHLSCERVRESRERLVGELQDYSMKESQQRTKALIENVKRAQQLHALENQRDLFKSELHNGERFEEESSVAVVDTSGLEKVEAMFRQELLDAAQQLREEHLSCERLRESRERFVGELQDHSMKESQQRTKALIENVKRAQQLHALENQRDLFKSELHYGENVDEELRNAAGDRERLTAEVDEWRREANQQSNSLLMERQRCEKLLHAEARHDEIASEFRHSLTSLEAHRRHESTSETAGAQHRYEVQCLEIQRDRLVSEVESMNTAQEQQETLTKLHDSWHADLLHEFEAERGRWMTELSDSQHRSQESLGLMTRTEELREAEAACLQEHRDLTELHETLKLDHDHLTAELQDVHSMLEASRSRETAHRGHNVELSAQLVDARDENSQRQHSLSAAELRCAEEQRSVNKLQADLATAIEEMRSACAEHDVALAKAQSEHALQETTFTDSLGHARSEIHVAVAEKKLAVNVTESLRSELQRSNTELGFARMVELEVQEHLHSETSQSETRVALEQKTQAAHAQWREELEAMQVERQDLRNRLDQGSMQTEVCEVHEMQQREMLKAMESEQRELLSSVDCLRHEVREKADLETAHKERSTLLNAEFARLQGVCREENEAATGELKRVGDEHEMLRGALEDKLEAIRGEHERLQEVCGEERDSLKAVQAQSLQHRSEEMRLVAEVEASQERLERTHTESMGKLQQCIAEEMRLQAEVGDMEMELQIAGEQRRTDKEKLTSQEYKLREEAKQTAEVTKIMAEQGAFLANSLAIEKELQVRIQALDLDGKRRHEAKGAVDQLVWTAPEVTGLKRQLSMAETQYTVQIRQLRAELTEAKTEKESRASVGSKNDYDVNEDELELPGTAASVKQGVNVREEEPFRRKLDLVQEEAEDELELPGTAASVKQGVNVREEEPFRRKLDLVQEEAEDQERPEDERDRPASPVASPRSSEPSVWFSDDPSPRPKTARAASVSSGQSTPRATVEDVDFVVLRLFRRLLHERYAALSPQELSRALRMEQRSTTLPKAEVEQVLRKFDAHQKSFSTQKAFQRLDMRRAGKISVNDFQEALRKNLLLDKQTSGHIFKLINSTFAPSAPLPGTQTRSSLFGSRRRVTATSLRVRSDRDDLISEDDFVAVLDDARLR